MLLSELFISYPRDDELVLARFAPINMIVSIEKGSIFDHEGHFVALVHHLKVAILVDWSDENFFVIGRQDTHLVAKVLNELLR